MMQRQQSYMGNDAPQNLRSAFQQQQPRGLPIIPRVGTDPIRPAYGNQQFQQTDFNNMHNTGPHIDSSAYAAPDQNVYCCMMANKKSSMKEAIQIFTAEFLGTAALMFVGCSTVLFGGLGGTTSNLYAAIGFGLAVTVAMLLSGHISGAHLNPAVTLAAAIVQKIDIIMVPVYMVAQFSGAILGYSILYFNLIDLVDTRLELNICCTDISTKERNFEFRGVVTEFVLTMILILISCGLWDQRNKENQDSNALKVGLSIVVLIMAGSNITGASFNTARSFAPALLYNHFDNHWIYWIGPNAGAVFGALLYRFLLSDSKRSGRCL